MMVKTSLGRVKTTGLFWQSDMLSWREAGLMEIKKNGNEKDV